MDGDEAPAAAAAAAAALARRVEITRAAILGEVVWIHRPAARAAGSPASATRPARASPSRRRPALDPALDAAPAVALGAFARRSETRWREQIERESERAVEDRRRQRHVDARLTRLERGRRAHP